MLRFQILSNSRNLFSDAERSSVTRRPLLGQPLRPRPAADAIDLVAEGPRQCPGLTRQRQHEMLRPILLRPSWPRGAGRDRGERHATAGVQQSLRQRTHDSSSVIINSSSLGHSLFPPCGPSDKEVRRPSSPCLTACSKHLISRVTPSPSRTCLC